MTPEVTKALLALRGKTREQLLALAEHALRTVATLTRPGPDGPYCVVDENMPAVRLESGNRDYCFGYAAALTAEAQRECSGHTYLVVCSAFVVWPQERWGDALGCVDGG